MFDFLVRGLIVFQRGRSLDTHSTEPLGIDPDPISLSMLFISAATLALQFIQVARDGPATLPVKKTRNGELARVESALEEALMDLERAVRAVERGTSSPDKEFFNSKFRIGVGVMRFDAEWHREYSSRLHSAFGKVTALSLFINSLIAQHPGIAAQVGERMIGSLSESADKLNQLIAGGGSNAEILAESKLVLLTCREIVTKLLTTREN